MIEVEVYQGLQILTHKHACSKAVVKISIEERLVNVVCDVEPGLALKSLQSVYT